jgi:clan AA aspartic protease (TIGR02281 family)
MRTLIFILALISTAAVSTGQTLIQMEKKGGVYYVPCTVNGLKLQFIFDTGASDVSISLSEAMFMIKNGYINEDDLIGTEYYQIANGELTAGTKLIIRTLEIGGKKLTNVKASIVHTTTAPLLLGQSVLERFGNVSVNYGNQTLTLGGNGVPAASNGQQATSSTNTVKDIGGNIYNTIKIGDQVWMTEDLRTDKYANGDRIPNVRDGESWGNLTSGAWAHYDNEEWRDDTYGKLYNGYAVADNRGLCPDGWSVPSIEDWEVLTKAVAPNANHDDIFRGPASKLRNPKIGSVSPIDVMNAPGYFVSFAGGFRAGGGGYRQVDVEIDITSIWWASSTNDLGYRHRVSMFAYNSDSRVMIGSHTQVHGYSVRCLKN